jgi:hypothetical protein
MKKEKLNKISRHNAIIRYITDNKDLSAGVRYSSEETDKNLYKDVLRGHDNGIFSDNKIVLSERKWIWISGKSIWASPWLVDTGLLDDARGKEIIEWNLRLWKAENFKLREIGEFSVNYEMDGDFDDPDKKWCDTSAEIFIKNEFFDTLENNILSNGIKFVKNLNINFGIYVNEKNSIKNEDKVCSYGYGVTSYDIDYSEKKKSSK